MFMLIGSGAFIDICPSRCVCRRNGGNKRCVRERCGMGPG